MSADGAPAQPYGFAVVHGISLYQLGNGVIVYNERLAEKILQALDEAFPRTMTVAQLKAALPEFSDLPDGVWRIAIDALAKDGFVGGAIVRIGFPETSVVRGPLTITGQGRERVQRAREATRQPSGPPSSNQSSSRLAFLTHAASDEAIAKYLKEVLESSITGLEVFVASDAEDLPPGDPWVETILSALKAAEVVLVLATERGVGRRWVWYETGASWSRGVRIIPCCLGRLRKGQLEQPFSTYQAVNLDEEGDFLTLLDSLARSFGVRLAPTDTHTVVSALVDRSQDAEGAAAEALSPDHVQRRVEAVEVSAKAEQPGPRSFLIYVNNESDEEVTVAEIRLLGEGGIRLTGPARPPTEGAWKIGPKSSVPISWRADPDPVASLARIRPNAGVEFETEMHAVLTCEILGRARKFDCKVWVHVNAASRQMRQLAG